MIVNNPWANTAQSPKLCKCRGFCAATFWNIHHAPLTPTLVSVDVPEAHIVLTSWPWKFVDDSLPPKPSFLYWYFVLFLIVLQQFSPKAEKQSRGKAPRNWILCKFSQSEGFFFSTLRCILNEMHFACLFKHYILNWFMMRPLYMVGYNLTLLRSICQG